MNTKRLVAECFGTFTLTFVVLASLAGSFPIPTPVLAALTLGLFVYSIGFLSGCHINPAVTLGLLFLNKMTWRDSLLYIVAQCIGASLALGLAIVLTLTIGGASDTTSWQAALGEIVGTAVFTFGIAAVVMKKVENVVSGIVIGASLLLGISIAILIGAPGILNPAVALGQQSLSVVTIGGPIIGAFIGMQIYKYLAEK